MRKKPDDVSELDERWHTFVQHLDQDERDRVLRILKSDDLYRLVVRLEGMRAAGGFIAGFWRVATMTIKSIITLFVVWVALRAVIFGEITASDALKWLIK